jgi:hypothetical protein
LIGRDKGPIRTLLKQALQSRSIGLGISHLLLLQLKAVLQHSTHRREASSVHHGLGKSMLILA